MTVFCGIVPQTAVIRPSLWYARYKRAAVERGARAALFCLRLEE
jgi:hypothetical protein